MPLQEAFERHAGVLLLLRRLPRRVEGEGVPHGVEALHEDVEIGGGASGGDLVGQDVHHVAESLGRGGGGVGLHLAPEEPLQGAGVGELVEGAAGQHDGPVAVAQRDLVLGRLVHAPPAVRVRGGDQRAAVLVGEGGEPGEAAGRGLPEVFRDARVDGGGAQFGDERGHGQRAARAAGDVLGLDAEFGQEARGLVAVVGGCLHRGDDEAFTRARGGHVEQAALLGEQRPGGEWFGEAVAPDAVGLQQGAAAAQIRPEPLLDARDDDEPPLQPLGAVRGHQAYGVRPYGAPGEGVGGDVLGVDLLQEVQGAAPAGALLGAGGGREQRAHGVEVPVGVAAGRAAAAGGPLQALGPGRALPEVPQRLLGRSAAGEPLACLAQQCAEALGPAGVRRVVRDQPLGLGQRAREQYVGGRGQQRCPPARSSSRSARPRRRRSAASMLASGEASRVSAVSVSSQAAEGAVPGSGASAGSSCTPGSGGAPSASPPAPGASTGRTASSSPSLASRSSATPAFSSVRRAGGGPSAASGGRASARGAASSDAPSVAAPRPGSASDAARATARSAVSSGATAGSWRSGRSSPSMSRGTPAAVRARRTVGIVREPARTRTAISPQATPSSRWARRRMSAMLSSSAPAVGYV